MHAHAAQLDADVGTAGKFAHRPAPLGEHLVAFAHIGTDAGGSADMVADDGRIGKGAREIDQVAELGVKQPGVEGQPEPAERGEAAAEIRIEEKTGWRVGAGRLDAVLVPRGDIADTAKAPAGSGNMRFQCRPGAVADTQIDIADDAGAGTRRTIEAA